MEKVAYLGPVGSYSHLAAIKMREGAEVRAYGSFYLVICALEKGECDWAVLPIENSLNGAVFQNIDLLQAGDVVAVEQKSLALDHRLATLKGAKLSGIHRIYSHEQSLAQCSEYLHENFPTAQLIATPSTAASLDMLKTAEDAAIVGAHLLRDGIELSPRNIADSKHNFTNFLLVRRGEVDENKKSERIFFSVTCRHKSGALLDILQPMSESGLNMTKIQSRPIKDSAGEYRFFIEVEGDYSSKEMRSALEKVKNSTLSFKLLGTY